MNQERVRSGTITGPIAAKARHRLLFVTHSDEWIGPNVSLLELVTRLPEELEALVAVPGDGRFVEALQERGIAVAILRRVDKWGIPALISMIRREKVALVYGNSAHKTSRNALIAAKCCNVPFVYHLREMAGSGLRRALRLFPWADAAIAVSKAAAESYRGSFRQSPRVIHNGVSPERFELDRASCRKRVADEFGIDEEAPIIIQVGNLNRRKGQRITLEVLELLRPRYPECRLLLVGRLDRDPEYVADLRAVIEEYGFEDRVILTGLRSDVGELLSAADLFLHTAVADPHPRAVVEAMAAGLPVVALAVDGVAETVVDGDTGYLVSWPCTARTLADRVAHLLSMPELSRTMGYRGRQRAKRLFSADRTAREVADEVFGLLGIHGVPSQAQP